MTLVIELTELLNKLQITSFHLVRPISFGEKYLSFGGFHLVQLRIACPWCPTPQPPLVTATCDRSQGCA